MLDLLAAGDSWRDDFNVGGRRFDGRNETAIADFCRQIVVFFFKAEGTGHAAAAGVDFADFVAGGFEHRHRRRRADERFLVAVAVQQGFLSITARFE